MHPDLSAWESARFTELQEAYSVLSDEAARHDYDSRLHASSASEERFQSRPEPLTRREISPEPLIPQHRQANLHDISLTDSFQTFTPSFEEIFDHLLSNFTRETRPKHEITQSLNIEVVVSPDQARVGGRARILVPARLVCPDCRGRGGSAFFECLQCGGEGTISGEYPLAVSFPPFGRGDYVVSYPLEDFGIESLYLTIHFRMSEVPV
jgi:molecular chaperone DnaJ